MSTDTMFAVRATPFYGHRLETRPSSVDDALARLPEYVEVGGDTTGIYVYVVTSHDGSLAVVSAVTAMRILCGNVLPALIRGTKRKVSMKHTSGLDLSVRYAEARRVLGITVDYAARFKAMGDALALDPFTAEDMAALAAELFPVEDGMSDRARTNRENARHHVRAIFTGNGPDGDTRGNAPGTKWTAYNAVAEWADWMQRRGKGTDQLEKSMADSPVKTRALALLAD
jgi:hypothetical protein